MLRNPSLFRYSTVDRTETREWTLPSPKTEKSSSTIHENHSENSQMVHKLDRFFGSSSVTKYPSLVSNDFIELLIELGNWREVDGTTVTCLCLSCECEIPPQNRNFVDVAAVGIVKDIETGKQRFFFGHNDDISWFALDWFLFRIRFQELCLVEFQRQIAWCSEGERADQKNLTIFKEKTKPIKFSIECGRGWGWVFFRE